MCLFSRFRYFTNDDFSRMAIFLRIYFFANVDFFAIEFDFFHDYDISRMAMFFANGDFFFLENSIFRDENFSRMTIFFCEFFFRACGFLCEFDFFQLRLRFSRMVIFS